MDIIAVIIALIVPIGVAIWSVRSSAKDTAKQIAALEESTTRQIESVKELARIQIEINRMQIQKEVSEARSRQLQTMKKSGDVIDRELTGYQLGATWKELQGERDKAKDLYYEREYWSQIVQRGEYWDSKLGAILKKDEGE